MSVEGKKLAIGVLCVDWRLHQEAVRLPEALRDVLGVDVVDIITLPGPDGFLKEGSETERDALLRALNLLIGAHHPISIAIVAHYNCAGHPVDDATHDADIAATVHHYKRETGFPGEMVAYSAVRKSDAQWDLKEVARI